MIVHREQQVHTVAIVAQLLMKLWRKMCQPEIFSHLLPDKARFK